MGLSREANKEMMARPRKHTFDIPQGMPVRFYKHFLCHEVRHAKREKQLMELIEACLGEIRRLIKQDGQMKNISPELAGFINQQRQVLKYYNNKNRGA